MKHIVREDFPELDTTNKFKDKQVQGFCKRFRISWQRRTNKKNKGVLERLNIAKNYHWWVIYKMESLRPHSMKIESMKKKKLKKKQEPTFVHPPPLPKLISKKKKIIFKKTGVCQHHLYLLFQLNVCLHKKNVFFAMK